MKQNIKETKNNKMDIPNSLSAKESNPSKRTCSKFTSPLATIFHIIHQKLI
jgi:hypothetical protein